MAFAAPLWLIGLIPWAGVALWILWGQREKIGVPFLPLWQSEIPSRAPRRQMAPPPIALLAALLAAMLAILAAARPQIFSGQSGHVTIIADRGLTMSVEGKDGKSRLVECARLANSKFNDAANLGIDLTAVPDSATKPATGNWLDQVQSLSPTAVVDPSGIARAARAALSDSSGLVIVLSDQAIGLQDDRLVQIAPPQPLVNVGIDLLSVRQSPRGQMMVRLVNQSPLQQAHLIVRGGGWQITRKIALPSSGQSRNYFVDLPAAWPVVEAEISADDPAAPNHHAWAVRRPTWPRVQARSSLPPEVQRMIQVYTHDRPAGAESNSVAEVDSSSAPPTDSPAAILADRGSTELDTTQAPVVAAAPLNLSDVDWVKALAGATAAAPPEGDWTPLVTVGEKVVVAARSQPNRQVWIGFSAPQFSRSADFVIFWKDVLDWLGDGEGIYTSGAIGPLVGKWRLQQPADTTNGPVDSGLVPGVYVGGDGTLQAVNAGTSAAAGASTPEWWDKLVELLNQSQRRPHELAGVLLILALGLLCVCAVSWVRQREPLRPIQVPVSR